jgi:hypothetical protein
MSLPSTEPNAESSPEPTTPARPRLQLVPPPEPWSGAAPGAAAALIPGQGTLDLTYLLRGGLPARPEPGIDLTLPAPRLFGPDLLEESGSPTDREVLPPPSAWVARLAQACLEVCTAGRPINQLLRWTSESVFEDLRSRYVPTARRAARGLTGPQTEKVRSVHVCEPANGVVEATAIIVGGQRTRALALRLEGWRGRWVCTALEWI